MQRAAASTSPSTPGPQAQQPREDSSLETPPSKRRRTESHTTTSVPAAPSDLQRIQVALDEEEAKRQTALDRLAEEAGETKWVLSTVNGITRGGDEGADGRSGGGLRITNAAFSEIDSEAWKPTEIGRKSFGKFNREVEVSYDVVPYVVVPLHDRLVTCLLQLRKQRIQRWQNGKTDQSSPSSSEPSSEASGEGDEDGEASDDPADDCNPDRTSQQEALEKMRAQRKAQRRAKKAALVRLAEKRKKKEVKLNRLSSISGTGGSGGGAGVGKAGRECYLCGEKGHEKRDCPMKGKRRYDDEGDGRVKNTWESLDY